ncbi:hypothetical protein BWQ96_08312 [Gracilariopsis chorda]|uniref:Uncharacterized protein n=1 Tax=Gracilariopsis chorda TaxID=448386 RepID=A0A2V3IIT1_9FLOR|nr:hypothetical protein BWQ96_08312 [Gracilariopsis chorda]|eukprot:PXF41958.1 hypothetical protein BWQ96_08312 [Gracilariopsis chorda]
MGTKGSGTHKHNVYNLEELLKVNSSSLVGRALNRVALETDFDYKFSRCQRQNYTLIKTIGYHIHSRKEFSNQIIKLGYSTNNNDVAFADDFDLFYEVLFGDAIDHFYYKPIVMLHAMARVCEEGSASHLLYTDLDVFNIRIGQGARKSSRITVHTEFFNSSANAGFILVPCKLHFVKQIIYWSLLGQSKVDLESDQSVLRCVIGVNHKMFNMMPANSLSHHAYSTTPNRQYVLRAGPIWNSMRACFRFLLFVLFMWESLHGKMPWFPFPNRIPPLLFASSRGTPKSYSWIFLFGLSIGMITIQDMGCVVENLRLGYLDNGRCNEYAKMYQLGTSKYIRLTVRKNKIKISTLEHCLMIRISTNPHILVLLLDIFALLSEVRLLFILKAVTKMFEELGNHSLLKNVFFYPSRSTFLGLTYEISLKTVKKFRAYLRSSWNAFHNVGQSKNSNDVQEEREIKGTSR